MSEFECPFCHHQHPGQAPLAVLKAIKANGIRRMVLDMLIAAYPNGVSRTDIIERIYVGTRNGGPDSADHIIANHISDLRWSLPHYGWTIPNYVGSGNRYRLVPIEETRKRAA